MTDIAEVAENSRREDSCGDVAMPEAPCGAHNSVSPEKGARHGIASGRQIKAARALLGWDATDLARAIGRHRNAVSYWETKDCISMPASTVVREIRVAFERAGLECFATPTPGIRLSANRAPHHALLKK